jgi:hypothetical protein
VLLAVLWIMVGIGGLTLAITAAARTVIAPARNRMALTAAVWSAAGCLAEARDLMAQALAPTSPQPVVTAATAWNRIDRTLEGSLVLTDPSCSVSARPLGAKLDVNLSDERALAMVLLKGGMSAGRAESTAAVLTSHRPFVDMRQLHLLQGLESVELLDSVLDVDAGPISLSHASRAVLGILPGFTDETVWKVLDARKRGTPVSGFLELASLLSPDAPGASARLPGVAVFETAAWVITVRATTGKPPVTAVLEARLIRSDSGTTIARRRSWLE